MSDDGLTDEQVFGTSPSQGAPAPQTIDNGMTDDEVFGPPVSTGVDVTKSAGVGLGKGAIGAAGLPGDISHMLDLGPSYLIAKGAEKLGLLPEGKTAEDLYSAVQAMDLPRDKFAPPTSGDIQKVVENDITGPFYQPQTTPGKYAGAAAEFIPQAVMAPGSAWKNALRYGVAPGVASEAAGEVFDGTSAEPYARIAGGLAGGLGAGLAEIGTGQAINAAKKYVQPLTESGRNSLAAATYSSLFSDPAKAGQLLDDAATFRDAVSPSSALGEIVPGSRPTTGQLTGDMGALSAERDIAQKAPDLFKSNEYGTGSQQQNSARLTVLNSIAPNGNPENLSASVRGQLKTIEEEHDAAISAATQQAQAAALGIGSGQTPEGLGAALRDNLQGARDAAKAKESALWDAVDPDRSLVLPASPVVEMANKVVGEMPSLAKPMQGEEAAIFGAVKNLPAVTPLSEMVGLRARLNDALQSELLTGGRSVVYRRLSQLRGSVESAIDNSVENRAAQEAQAVQSGVLAPEDTMENRLAQLVDSRDAQKDSLAASGVGSGENPSPGNPRAPGVFGTKSQTIGRLGNDAGPQGISGQAFPGNLVDDATAQRLKAASAATKDRAATFFDQGPVGDVLRNAGNASTYDLPASAVPAKLWVPGPRGAETVSSYLKAAGPNGMDALASAASESLARKAMTPTGTIDPGKFTAWQNQHQDALRAMPNALRSKFTNAAMASQAVENAAIARKQAVDSFQQGAVQKILGVSDAEDVTKTIGGILGQKDAVKQISTLARRAAGNTDAQEGLRKAVVDAILAKAKSTTEAGASGDVNINATVFQKFIRDNSAAIRAAGISDDQMNVMRAIGMDLQRGQRTLQAPKLPGGSDTTQGLIKTIQKIGDAAGHPSLLTKISAGAFAGHKVYGLTGAVLGAGAFGAQHLVSAMRMAGIEKANILVRDAMLNPELGRTLLKQAPKMPNVGSEITLRNVLMRNSALTAARSANTAAQRGNAQ